MAVAEGLARAALRPFIPGFIEQGLSARAIQRRFINEFGHAYRWTNLLEDVRIFSGRMKKEEVVINLARGQPAGRYAMIETTLKRPFNYRVIGDATYYDPATMEFGRKTVSFYDTQNRGLDEWEREFLDQIERRPYETDLQFTGFQARSIEHMRGWQY